MSEIELLYKNAGIELQYLYTVEYMGNDGVSKLTGCNKETILNLFPEYNKRNYKVTKANKTDNFTPEKQLELIKWCGEKNYTISIHFHENEWGIATEDYSGYFQDNLADALASIINTHWQDLTETEREEIRKILKG